MDFIATSFISQRTFLSVTISQGGYLIIYVFKKHHNSSHTKFSCSLVLLVLVSSDLISCSLVLLVLASYDLISCSLVLLVLASSDLILVSSNYSFRPEVI